MATIKYWRTCFPNRRPGSKLSCPTCGRQERGGDLGGPALGPGTGVDRTPTGAPPTTCRSARSISTTTRCSRSRSPRSTSSRACLGHWGTTPGLNFIYVHLNRMIKKHDLDMIYITGPGHGGPGLVANAYLEGTYSEVYPNISAGRGGHEAPLHPVLVPRRHPQPRGAGDARLDPRGRRARLRPLARLRRRLRQPRPDRRLRRRRRRGGDRAAGDELALQQVPQPGGRRGGAADPAPQRLQDRQPHRPGADQPRGAGPALPRLRLHALLRRGRRPGHDARAHGQHARHRHRRDPAHPGRRAPRRLHRAPPLADDRAPHAQGVDLPEGDRRQAYRGLLARAPGADGRDAREPGPRPRCSRRG